CALPPQMGHRGGGFVHRRPSGRGSLCSGSVRWTLLQGNLANPLFFSLLCFFSSLDPDSESDSESEQRGAPEEGASVPRSQIQTREARRSRRPDPEGDETPRARGASVGWPIIRQ